MLLIIKQVLIKINRFKINARKCPPNRFLMQDYLIKRFATIKITTSVAGVELCYKLTRKKILMIL